METIVIDACRDLDRIQIEPQLNHAFEFISENILRMRVVDPSNSQNIISYDLTENDKNRIKNLADEALQARSWKNVIY